MNREHGETNPLQTTPYGRVSNARVIGGLLLHILEACALYKSICIYICVLRSYL